MGDICIKSCSIKSCSIKNSVDKDFILPNSPRGVDNNNFNKEEKFSLDNNKPVSDNASQIKENSNKSKSPIDSLLAEIPNEKQKDIVHKLEPKDKLNFSILEEEKNYIKESSLNKINNNDDLKYSSNFNISSIEKDESIYGDFNKINPNIMTNLERDIDRSLENNSKLIRFNKSNDSNISDSLSILNQNIFSNIDIKEMEEKGIPEENKNFNGEINLNEINSNLERNEYEENESKENESEENESEEIESKENESEENELEEIKNENEKFEMIFRSKLILSYKEQNNFSNLIHLDELKIPFPDDEEKLQDRDYLNKCIEDIDIKVDGKYTLTKSHIDITSIDNVNYFIENAFNEISTLNTVNYSVFNKVKNYIGINFKKDNRGNYIIYLLYATDYKK